MILRKLLMHFLVLGGFFAAAIYVFDISPTVTVVKEKPVVGKFVSTTGDREDSYTRPKGFMEYIWDIAKAMERRSAPPQDTGVAGRLQAIQDRRNPDASPGGLGFSDIVTNVRQAFGHAKDAGVPVGPTLFDPYVAEQERNAPSYDPIVRLKRGQNQ